MSSVDLAAKAALLATNLQQLKRVGDVAKPEYLADEGRQLMVERAIEKVVEAATDINAILLFNAGLPPPSTYREAFLQLPRLGLCSEHEARKLAATAGLRNRIAHEYEMLDQEKVFDSISGLLSLYTRYLASVEKHILSTSTKPSENGA